MPDTFIKIASVTVGAGGAASMAFSSIPSTYTDLCLKFSARASNVGANEVNISISINGSTSNFSQRAVYGDGSATGSFSRTDNLNITLVTGAGATASTFGSAEMYFPNYAGSTFKSFSVDDVTEGNITATYAQLQAGLWSNTAAINAVSIAPQGSGSFVQYSTATLYGIKNS